MTIDYWLLTIVETALFIQAKVSGLHLGFDLKFHIGRDREGLARGVGFPIAFARQHSVKFSADDSHNLCGRCAELILADSHYTYGGGAIDGGES